MSPAATLYAPTPFEIVKAADPAHGTTAFHRSHVDQIGCKMKRVRLGLRIFVLLSCVGLAAIAFLVWGAGGHRRDERTFRAEELAVYHSLLSDWIQSGYRQINLVSIPMSLNVADCQSGRRSGEARRGRHRVALALMGDAGYDPWQAPEAWRLVDAEKLPSDLATLDYTDAGASELRPRAGGIH